MEALAFIGNIHPQASILISALRCKEMTMTRICGKRLLAINEPPMLALVSCLVRKLHIPSFSFSFSLFWLQHGGRVLESDLWQLFELLCSFID